jgi:hypothetical protein
MKLTGENQSTRGKPVPVPLCPTRIPYGPTSVRTRASAGPEFTHVSLKNNLFQVKGPDSNELQFICNRFRLE